MKRHPRNQKLAGGTWEISLMIRLYGPEMAALDGSYRLPQVKESAIT